MIIKWLIIMLARDLLLCLLSIIEMFTEKNKDIILKQKLKVYIGHMEQFSIS